MCGYTSIPNKVNGECIHVQMICIPVYLCVVNKKVFGDGVASEKGLVVEFWETTHEGMECAGPTAG